MFSLEREIGCHKVFTFDTETIKFKKYLEELLETEHLTEIHLESKDYRRYLEGKYDSLENVETDLQKKFYADIKSKPEFKQLYCALVKKIYEQFFQEEPFLIYQSFPSIRFQFPKNIAVPPHSDSDELGCHPLGEKNFIVPITAMRNTTRLFIETEPGKKDYQGIDLDYGNLFYFNGNKCVHYNETNQENYTRISFDFRVIKKEDYYNYIMTSNITKTNPRDLYKERQATKMIIGGYYQCMFREETLESSMNWLFNKETILQTRPVFDEREGKASMEYFQQGDPFLTEFKETETLEKMLKEYIGVKHCYMTTSGSTALVTALIACNIQPGDDVLVPDYTMIATANAIRLLGANPILVDVNPETYTIDLETIQAKKTEKTKAVIHVSLNNRCKHLQKIAEYCKENGLFLIEDSAQSLGAKYEGKAYGTYGDIGCFSLSSPKIITTGQGGFLVTNNDELASRIFKIKNFGRRSGGIEEYDMFGLNFKFTDIQAVIGQEQMKKLPNRVERMKQIFTCYKKHIADISGIQLLDFSDRDWIPWFIDIVSQNRDNLMLFLKKHDILTRVTYPSIHETDIYRKNSNEKEDYTNTNFISKNGIFLPTHFRITDEQIKYICTILKVFSLQNN